MGWGNEISEIRTCKLPEINCSTMKIKILINSKDNRINKRNCIGQIEIIEFNRKKRETKGNKKATNKRDDAIAPIVATAHLA